MGGRRDCLRVRGTHQLVPVVRHDANCGNHIDNCCSGRARQTQRDHIVRDSDLAKGIQRRQALRILPEIEKVFFFRVTCQEAVRIGRYDSAREAFFGPHRDNIPPNTHRRFALTLNLNDGYTGGALRFPEYGPHLYRPPIGGAIVFPCSLIHEALPVTAGDRFAAITFYFGDAEREAYKAKHAAQSQGA